jgi:hypothetical protein
MVELCGVSNKFHGFRRELPDTDVYLYRDNGEQKFTEDEYGEPMKMAKLEEAIIALRKAQVESISEEGYNRHYGYRRYAFALGLLESMVGTEEGHEIVVLFYGH